jgi:hypothetical protein
MDLEDFWEPEVVIAVGVGAALASPPVRRVLRRGAVYGLAGLMIAGDKIAALTRNAAASAQNAVASMREAAHEGTGAAARSAEPARA